MPKIDVFLRGSLKDRRLMTKGGGGQKSRKIDDVFYECHAAYQKFKKKLNVVRLTVTSMS